MPESYCQSCMMPLEDKGARASAKYCRYCADSKGELKPREEVKANIALWLMQWQIGISEEVALERAEHYMRAMPAWAQEDGESW